MNEWIDGWMDGWVHGWMDGRAGLRIAYSNQQKVWCWMVGWMGKLVLGLLTAINKTGTDWFQDCCKNWSITQD